MKMERTVTTAPKAAIDLYLFVSEATMGATEGICRNIHIRRVCHNKDTLPFGPRLASSKASNSRSRLRDFENDMYFHWPRDEETKKRSAVLKTVESEEIAVFKEMSCHDSSGLPL